MTMTDRERKYIALMNEAYRHPDRLISVKRFKDHVEVTLDYQNARWTISMTFEAIPKHLSDEALYQRAIEHMDSYSEKKETK